MLKYYLMAIQKGNSIPMLYLGYYYCEKHKYDEMKKYYFMAIEKENSIAMYELGEYYPEIEKQYDEMKKYYLMAIEKGNSIAMYNLGLYYQDIEKNDELMKKYYFMAIEKENSIAMYNLGLYYQDIEMNEELMKKYYLMSIESSLINLINYSKINRLLLFYYLNSIHNKSDKVTDVIYDLLKFHDVSSYALSSKKRNECPIFFENEIHIPFDNMTCDHTVCCICYTRLPNKVCSYRCPTIFLIE